MSNKAPRLATRRNFVVVGIAAVVFFIVGFFLPTLIVWGALSIAAAVGSDPSGSVPDIPLNISLLVGALLAAGSVVGLGIRMAERSESSRRADSG